MRRLLALGAIAAVAAVAAPTSASASGCGTTVVDAGGAAYIVVDEAALPDTVSVWIYQESNGTPGLQRSADGGDSCGGEGGDTVIF